MKRAACSTVFSLWRPRGPRDCTIAWTCHRIDPMKLGRGLRLNNALYPIHVAAIGGRVMDAVTFLSGLALAALGVFGLWSFLVKPRWKKAKPS